MPSRWAKVKRLVGERAPFLPAGWRARAVLGGYPRTLLDAAREGERVKVVGQVRPVAPLLKSPITGQSCVFYRLLVVEIVLEGDNRSERPIADDERRCDFAVVDPSGEALIQPGGAEMNVPASWEDRYHPALERIARESSRLSASVWGERLRYQEVMLRPEAWVAVLGAGRADAHGGRDVGAPGLVFANTPAQPLVVSSALDDWFYHRQ